MRGTHSISDGFKSSLAPSIPIRYYGTYGYNNNNNDSDLSFNLNLVDDTSVLAEIDSEIVNFD